MLVEFEQGKSHLGTAARRNHCHAERSGEESAAILAAQSKHPYRDYGAGHASFSAQDENE
jgi:hypothetical protein